MAEDRPFDAEWTELEKIDFLLDELARAVERGEVHRASYQLMAPRYLSRRRQLVATIGGRPWVEEAPVSRPPGRAVEYQGAFEQAAAGARPGVSSAAPSARVRPVPVPAPVRPAPKPVAWTTVLLFLGAFLVIVAAAIFSIVIWDLLGVTGKLALLGSVTAGFYAAGWYVRTKLDVPPGATALTTVASAMLLFDGWTAIRGYELEGPLPWAVLLLVCSGVYWFTEVRLANRFFGVIGAAAQMGWWWLLGDGLGLPVTTRLAGMALVALAWQIAAERGRDNKTVGSLANVLEWAAPIAGGLLSLGVVADLVLVQTAGPVEALAAGVVAGSAWFTVVRTREIDPRAARFIAAMLQLPLLGVMWTAYDWSGPAWWVFAGFLALSFAYGAYALTSGRHPFAVLAVATEFSAAWLLLDLLNASDEVVVVALAGLAAVWALAARLAATAASLEGAPEGIGPLAQVAEVASVALLVVVSLAVPVVGDGVPLSGTVVARSHVVVAFGVLVAWIAATLVRTREVGLTGTALFSFYVLAAFMAWRMPDLAAAYYAIGLLVLAFAWLAAARFLERVYSPAFVHLAQWADRALIGFIALAGLMLEVVVFGTGEPTVPAVVLAAATAAAFGYDATVNKNVVAAAASSAFAVGTAALAAGTIDDPRTSQIAVTVSGPAAALGIAGAATLVRTRSTLRPSVAAVTAAGLGTVVALGGWGEPGWLALALAMVALAWAACAWRFDELFALPAGLAVMGAAAACAAAVDAGTWPTVAFVGAGSLLLAAVALVEPFGPEGAHARAGALLGVAGLGGIAALTAIVFLEAYGPADRGWLALGAPERTVLLLAIASGVLLQGWRWRFEPATYAGWLFVLFAAWTSWGDSRLAVGEWYTTSLALYLAAMGYAYLVKVPGRRYPVMLDAAAAVVGLALPLMWALVAGPNEVLTHFLWVFGLSMIAIALGVLLKVRWYFFGGVGALALVAVYRSFTTLAQFSWLLLGVIGIAMLVVAVTWEQQRSTRERLLASFQNWR